ncbi:MAG: hypothetical protein JW984_14050 [Deltaproteobacteria bacterium]|uniref:Uncharacterized protein n=1 Tax=Candidatus Zymogenus saltonus TaxID=2844893 RepID=A0A9D8KHW7_9DELT|nr:hypothetical protein [Candidatus Zymogenus saltonus]
MDFQNIVLPYEPSLIEALEGRDAELIVHVNDISEIVPAADDVLSSRNRLRSIVVGTDKTLDLLDFSGGWETIPVILYSPGPGSFKDLQQKFDLIHKLNLRPLFPADNKEGVVGLQTLSSTGFQCGVDFGFESPNWEALTDLMTYAILMTTSHANVEPFSYLIENYNPHEFNDWSSVYFDDPKDFLHLDSQGRAALTYSDLASKNFIAENISEVDSMEVCLQLEEKKRAWRRYFLENLPCSTCEGWRVCLGKFERLIDKSGLCSAAPFFKEMLDILDQKYFEIDNRDSQPQQQEMN